MRRWEEIYSAEERAVGESRGNRKRQDFGKNPALLIIDVNWRCIGPRDADLQAIPKYKSALWAAGWAVLPNIQRLLNACRSAEIPAVFATGDTITRSHFGTSAKVDLGKEGAHGRDRKPDLEAEDMPDEIAPLPTELIIRKTKASAFFQTPLDNCLRDRGIDCLLVGGNSTSGCVRASVVDAWAHGYRVFLVEECCYDRLQLSHLVNLYDMNLKYADVITLEEALENVAQTQKMNPLTSGREKVGKSV